MAIEHTNQIRACQGLPPAEPLPQWFIDMYSNELLDDDAFAAWLAGCGQRWATIAEVHVRCLGKVDRSLRKALKRGWINPAEDRRKLEETP